MNQNIRSIQTPVLSFSLPGQMFRTRDGFSEDFIRLSVYTLGTLFVFFLVVSLFFSWNTAREKAGLAQQQLVHENLIREKAGLEAKRDQLLAKPRLVALGAAQLDLHLPEKDQEHYLY